MLMCNGLFELVKKNYSYEVLIFFKNAVLLNLLYFIGTYMS